MHLLTRARSILLLCGLVWTTALHADAPEPLAPQEIVWLQQHNAARAQFGSAPLEWSEDLAQAARRWAMHLAQAEALRHSANDQRGATGENLWMGTRGYFAPGAMIESFLNERTHFVAGRFPQVSRTGDWSDVGHYTQIVWPETRAVGCALASGERFDVLVCRYWPAGNVMGVRIEPGRRFARN